MPDLSKAMRIFEKDVEETELPKVKETCVMDTANVMMICTKDARVAKLMENFKRVEKKPELKKYECCSKYSTEYLEKIVEFLKSQKMDAVEVCVDKDYPMKCKGTTEAGDESTIILAPRVEEE